MRTKILLLFLPLFTNQALAHSDVLLRSDGTKTLVGAASDLAMEEGGPFFDLETNVFEAVFFNPASPQFPFNYDFERGEPGFYSEPGLSVGLDLPGSADVSLALTPFSLPTGTDTAFYWDGSGAVDFQPISVAQPGVAFTFAPMGPSPFATTAAGGSLDDHPLFGLTGGAADGVYLVRPSATVAGLDASDPFSMVWLASSVLTTEDLAEELEEALEAYEEGGPEPVVGGTNFAFFEEAVEFAEGVPEPSAGLLVVVGAAVSAFRRR